MACLDQNGKTLAVDDEVVFLGRIAAITPGIHCVANVEVQQQGELVELTFYAEDLIKNELGQARAILGDVDRPTEPDPE